MPFLCWASSLHNWWSLDVKNETDGNIVDVIFSHTDRNAHLRRSFDRCDVTQKFPFEVTRMSSYDGR